MSVDEYLAETMLTLSLGPPPREDEEEDDADLASDTVRRARTGASSSSPDPLSGVVLGSCQRGIFVRSTADQRVHKIPWRDIMGDTNPLPPWAGEPWPLAQDRSHPPPGHHRLAMVDKDMAPRVGKQIRGSTRFHGAPIPANLDADTTHLIMQALRSETTLCTAALVCRGWFNAAMSSDLWKYDQPCSGPNSGQRITCLPFACTQR